MKILRTKKWLFNDKDNFSASIAPARSFPLRIGNIWRRRPSLVRLGSAYIWYQPGFGICMSFFILHTHTNQDPFLHMTTYLFLKCLSIKLTSTFIFYIKLSFIYSKNCVTLMWVPQCGRVSTKNLGEHCSPCAFQIGQIICIIHISDIDFFYHVFFLRRNELYGIFIYLNRLYNDC